MNNNIYLICGESDLLPELEKIKSNPNYVFQADPTYTPINLFNEFGDVITVNSWVECANYVNGGWINNIVEFINYERYLFIGLSIVTCLLFIPEILNYVNRFFDGRKEGIS